MVLTVRHWPYRAVLLWYWQSGIGHTKQCSCGTDSQTSAIHSSALGTCSHTSAIHSSALVVLTVRHRPYTAVPLWYCQKHVGHTQQCPCGTDSQTSAIHSIALTVLAVRHRPYTAVPLVLTVRHRPYTAVPLWYWQSDIGHTEQCPCGTGSQTSAIQSSALVVLAVRHRPYRAVPLWY